MTRKMSDLKEFVTHLKKEGYRGQIPLNHLKYYIAERFGISDYTIKATIKNLLDFGFLEDVGVGIFRVADGWRPNVTNPIAERIAEKEADDLIKKVKHGKPK